MARLTPRSFEADGGLIAVHCDTDGYDFHVTAMPGYSPSAMRGALDQLAAWGLALIPEDDCPPEELPNGGVRIYAMPLDPEWTPDSPPTTEEMMEAA